MFDRAIRNEPLVITGSGNETRDFTFVSDIVTGTLLAGIHPEGSGEVFNIAGGSETSIWELAELIKHISGTEADVSCVAKRRWDLADRRVASIEKACRLLGYSPTISLFDGLTQTYQWFTKVLAEVEQG